MNNSIVICGEKYDIGTRVVLWDEPNGLNGYDTTSYTFKAQDRKTGKIIKRVVKGKRYSSRSKINKVDRNWLNKNISQFFLHHSGLYHSQTTFNVLHKERGLSVHFILDDDGTIYQTLDIKEKAWHGGSCNPFSIGIEIDSRALGSKYSDAYDEVHQKKYNVGPRNLVLDEIHNVTMKGFDYSDLQYASLVKLIKICCDQFNIKKDFPRSSGEIIKTVVPNFKKLNGLICHYHITDDKIDPISLNYNRILRGIGNFDYIVREAINLSTLVGRQKALKTLGFYVGKVDGIFGGKTFDAIKRFQRSSNIPPSGMWDDLTQTLIMTALFGLGIITVKGETSV